MKSLHIFCRKSVKMIWVDYLEHVNTGDSCHFNGVGYEVGDSISETQREGTCGRIFINDPVLINDTKGQFGIQGCEPQSSFQPTMELLLDTHNCGLRMRRECQERFTRHRLQSKPLVSDPGMQHGTCVTHALWCMRRSLTRGGGEMFSAFPGHAQPAILRNWQETHGMNILWNVFLLFKYFLHFLFVIIEAWYNQLYQMDIYITKSNSFKTSTFINLA